MKLTAFVPFLLCTLLSAGPLSNKELNWYFVQHGQSISAPKEASQFIDKYNVYYVGDQSKKQIFLTFDEGYENGYTAKILDVLKENKVPAAFFVVKPYIKQNPDLIKRMEAEGHLVCNHSSTHPSMASVTDPTKFNKEFDDVNEEYKKLVGKDIPKFFRPPMGKFSESSLQKTQEKGYKTVFWSFAYRDWLVDNQPTHIFAKNKILGKAHSGEIMLLHAVSKTNTEILDDIIKELKNQGYEFKSLNDLP
ncbi:delta-lactam-biosynthetic de-N-acetylase [Inconstantimicrobium mannanitabidum]|uniref:Uncharacterized protein n=1 Tax=Inconstantimicrobium mannanitabidum TaxID=1604901 RepID=A0ACB5RAP6_9CLOT|nr:delta-lactam-biosynthetic de-N-acetylase [Clostridium sp. TW13]GKX66111.1 hypothetical protein rsdtw13_13690 [Clostridium sp. TW13]